MSFLNASLPFAASIYEERAFFHFAFSLPASLFPLLSPH
jgi:hypothetical protein